MRRLQEFDSDIAAWAASREADSRREDATAFLFAGGDAALRREGGPEHFTASCVVFDPDAEHVLLHHHRKADAWGQFGGHIEERDASFRAAAWRECREESGLATVDWLSPAPVDIHVHELAGAFGRCRIHRDVVFAAIAPTGTATVVSAESHSVAWFPLNSLPSSVMPDLPKRLPELFAAAAQLRTTAG